MCPLLQRSEEKKRVRKKRVRKREGGKDRE
jgi:hypothetical protein